MDPIFIWSMVAVLGLVLTNFFADHLRWVEKLPHETWLSFAGGVSVTYVFLHILPEISQAQQRIRDEGILGFLESHAYLAALVGLVLFYGMERLARRSRRSQRDQRGEDRTQQEDFWVHVIVFALYYFIIGYLLLNLEDVSVSELLLFATAMSLHFLVNDYALREHHKDAYHKVGRWILSAAVLLGWVMGAAVHLNRPVIDLLFAFLGGSIMLNVLKEELPEERQSDFRALLAGASLYTALMLIV